MERKYKHRSIDVHDFEHAPLLRGRVLRREPIQVDDEVRETLVIDTGVYMTRVFASAGLQEAFDVSTEGDCIEIRFLGRKALKGAKTFKRFSVQVWEGSLEETEETTETKTP